MVVSGYLRAAFQRRLRSGACQVYVSDLEPLVEPADTFLYPDAMVSCDERDPAASQFIARLVLIAEGATAFDAEGRSQTTLLGALAGLRDIDSQAEQSVRLGRVSQCPRA